MEENKPPLLKATIGYGVMVAIAIIIFSLILYVADIHRDSSINFLSYVILLAGIFIASLNYRNRYLEGYCTYGQALGAGFLTALWASIIIGIYTFIFFTYVDSSAIQEAIITAEESMIERGMSDVEIDQAMPMVNMFNKPWIWAIFALLGNAIIGLILALITSIFVKKEDNRIITDEGQ
jgi:hypothetical protein